MKHFDLTPGDSRDYHGVRVRVVAVSTRKKPGQPTEPVVTVQVELLETDPSPEPLETGDAD